jgi:hypothetical protein
MKDTALTPIALVAVELGTTADELAITLGDAVEFDAIGVRCVSADTARRLIADHRAAIEAERDRKAAQREAARQRPDPVRERVKALRRSQARWQHIADVPALGRMAAADIRSRDGRQQPTDERNARRRAGPPSDPAGGIRPMSVTFQLLGPPQPQRPLRQPVEARLLEMREQTREVIDGIDKALLKRRIRRHRVERRSTPAAAQRRPAGVEISYHPGSILSVR